MSGHQHSPCADGSPNRCRGEVFIAASVDRAGRIRQEFPARGGDRQRWPNCAVAPAGLRRISPHNGR
ncbi:hypothetical protein EF903_28910 [Streptomyces sp. WAC05292]|nr:hypothetical protein EF903_28910 [Streptomyces sp. WAC05292]